MYRGPGQAGYTRGELCIRGWAGRGILGAGCVSGAGRGILGVGCVSGAGRGILGVGCVSGAGPGGVY